MRRMPVSLERGEAASGPPHPIVSSGEAQSAVSHLRLAQYVVAHSCISVFVQIAVCIHAHTWSTPPHMLMIYDYVKSRRLINDQ